LTNSFLVIGSANLSSRSAESLVESAVVTDSDILLSQAKSFCHNLTKESIPLTRPHLERILKIKVVKRAFKPTGKSATRKKIFGNRYWFISLQEMTDRQGAKIDERINNAKEKVLKKTNYSSDDLGSIYFRKQNQFSTLAKEGDQILIKWRNAKRTDNFVFPFATILQIDKENGETIIIHDESSEDEFRLSKFIAMAKKLNLEKPISKPRTKEISANDAKKLKSIWK
jgi:hypothetical protein